MVTRFIYIFPYRNLSDNKNVTATHWGEIFTAAKLAPLRKYAF